MNDTDVIMSESGSGTKSHPVFGLIRSDVLRKTAMIGRYVNSDRVLLGELTLHGKFYEVPEFLFFKRNYSETSVNLYLSYRSRAEWFDPTKKGKLQLVRWRMFFEYLRAINRVRMSWPEKGLCQLQVGKWFMWYSKWLARDLIKALIQPFLPRLLKVQRNEEMEEAKQS